MDIEQEFEKSGGIFLTPPKEIRSALKTIKAFVFDWDGVFNDGRKTSVTDSSFSEIDSMGINLLRFDYWLRYNRFPLMFIITGMKNETAAGFARREHFDGIFQNSKNKKEALESLCTKFNVSAGELAFIFDDILDLEIAKMCGLSFCAGRKSNPLLTDYLIQNRICNYISGFSGHDHAVREICELIIGLSGDYKQAVELRMLFKGKYEEFLTKRNLKETEVVSL
jgi:3-deoxy-D-manno-octulosonate 8-phosphate phosphatase (KDO 8-P phosphatase)